MEAAGVLITVEECPRCGVKLKRSFQDGDYVGKEGGICDFCSSRMYIKMIYLEPARRRRAPSP